MSLACFALVSAVIAFIIGLPTFLVGCNSSFPALGCLSYNQVEGIAFQYKVEKTTCGGGKIPTYDCYYSYVKFNHVDNNSTLCRLRTQDYGTRSEKDARSYLYQYDLGSTYSLLQAKAAISVCTLEQKDTWIAGFSFLCLSVASLCCYVCAVFYQWHKKRAEALPVAHLARRNAIADIAVEMLQMPTHSFTYSAAPPRPAVAAVIPTAPLAVSYHIV